MSLARQIYRYLTALPSGKGSSCFPGGSCPQTGLVHPFTSSAVAHIVLTNPTPAEHRGTSPYTDFAYRHDQSQHGSGYYVYLSPPDTVVNR